AAHHFAHGVAAIGRPRVVDAQPTGSTRARGRRSSGRTQGPDRVRRRSAAGGALAPAGFLRPRPRPFDLQGTGPSHPPSAGAERTRPAGDAGPRGILGTPLPGDPPRADAKVSEARVAGKRRHRLAAFSESPALRAAPA